MNNKTVAVEQIKALKNKLSAAIESKASLEEDFNAQTDLLTQFISKLSHVSKGINLELDNRLAQLRVLLTKSAPISDIEEKIVEISKLLQQHATTNEQNITILHQKFIEAGKNLQKINGLPNDLRRKLRGLIASTEAENTKDSLTQYIPLLSQLLEFYDFTLKAKTKAPKAGLLAAYSQQNKDANNDEQTEIVNSEFIEKISIRIKNLELSTQHSKELIALNKKLNEDTSNEKVIEHFIKVFDFIVDDLKNERDNAKNFLTTLNLTLSTVQSTVKKTLSNCQLSQETHDKINKTLKNQLIDMSGSVEQAASLDKIKIDISDKLQTIGSILEQKSQLEHQHQKTLVSQLDDMAVKVKKLEKQSKSFEKKLADQQLKSMQDALTKLSNRAAFDDYFSKSIVRYYHKPFDLALIVMDIDDFKYINDNYGHTAGDKTLQVIASTIKKKLPDDTFVARYGGEEFVIIYNNIKKAPLMKELQALNQSIAKLPFRFKNNNVNITLSMGVTHITTDDNIHTAFERADKAMYKAKAQGKNQVIYFK